jgi:hypothetical protein
LLGAFALEQAKKDDKVAELYQKMDKFLIRNSDRVLFDLPMLAIDTKKTKQQTA